MINVKGNGGVLQGKRVEMDWGSHEGQGKFMPHLLGLEETGYQGKNSSTLRRWSFLIADE